MHPINIITKPIPDKELSLGRRVRIHEEDLEFIKIEELDRNEYPEYFL